MARSYTAIHGFSEYVDGDLSWGLGYNDTMDRLEALVPQHYGWRIGASTGLVYGYEGATEIVAGTVTIIAPGTVTLTANALNYVERNSSNVVSANTSGWTPSYTPIATAQTNATAIVTVVDRRPLGGTATSAGATTFASLTSKPTTFAGYGITDLQTQVLSSYVLGAATALANTDTLIGAFNKLQAQINAKGTGSGSVTGVSTAAANNGVTATWATASSTPALTIGLGAITPTSVNGLTLTAATTGFTLAGGNTTSKTLTISQTLTLNAADATSTLTIPAGGGTLGSAAFTAASAYATAAQVHYIGTTSIAANRASAIQALTGISSIDGYAGGLQGGNGTTLLGTVPYQAGANVTALLAPNTTTTKLFFSQTGTGTNGAAPAWAAVSKTDVGLGTVENTALSTWAGTANVVTVGTIGTGTWNATAIADGKIAAALTGKTYNALTLTAAGTGFTIAGGTVSKTLTVNKTLTLSAADDTSTLTIPAGGGTLGSAAFTAATAYAAVGATFILGTTSLALNRASAAVALTGITSIDGSAAAVAWSGVTSKPVAKTPLRWFYETVPTTTDKQPAYRIDTASVLKAVRWQNQVAGTGTAGTITIKINGVTTQTITLTISQSTTAWIDAFTGLSTALAAGDSVTAVVASNATTMTGLTVHLDIEQIL